MRSHILALTIASLATILCGCVCPRPQSFTEVKDLPRDFVGVSYKAFAEQQKLIIEVSQTPGFNIVGFTEYVYDGTLYLVPGHISSGGPGSARFEVDVSKYHFAEDWPKRVYWLVGGPYWYPILNAGFWSKAHRDPWSRMRVEIVAKS